ncbi:MAG TPA: ABC transporter permease, partial [Candidatus Acidoferrum sp.]|nr:ABC transporter permease [Candidatus Acidoferrum sp.]
MTVPASVPRRVPSDAVHFWLALRYQFDLYIRTMRFVGLLAFVFLVIGALVAGTIFFGLGGTDASEYLSGDLAYFTILGVVVAAFIGGDAISMDFGSGTGYYALALPIRRTTLLLGRYVAAFVVAMVLIGVFYLVSLTGALWAHGAGGFPWFELGESFVLAGLFALGVLSVAFCFSSIFRSPAVSMIMTVIVLFFGLGTATGELPKAGVEPWFSVLYGGLVVQAAVPTRASTLFGP